MEYKTPQLTELGSFAELTLGMNGSSLDGQCTTNQRGYGNDGVSGTAGGQCKP
jgi:hypothetical protein